MPDLNALDYGALSAPITPEQLKAFRAPREIKGYIQAHGLDEQKDAPAVRGVVIGVFLIMAAVPCTGIFIGMVVGVIQTLVLHVAKPSDYAVIAVSLILVGGITWLLIRGAVSVFHGPPGADLWRKRLRLDAFARSNGLSYVFRSAPEPLATLFDNPTYGVHIGDLLRTVSGQGVMVGVHSTSSRYGSSDHCFVAIDTGFPHSPRVTLTHRSRTKDTAIDPASVHFKVTTEPQKSGDGTGDYRSYFTSEVVAALVATAPGYDADLISGWLVVQTWTSDDLSKAEVLRELFTIAGQVGPRIAATAKFANRSTT